MTVPKRWHKAEFRGPVPNRYVGGMLAQKGLVLHIQQGYESGTNTSFHEPSFQASAHFGVAKTGHVDQWVECQDAAWAEMAGNRYWTSVEIEGFSGQSLTSHQLESLAQLYAWGHENLGWKFQLCNEVAGEGLIYHAAGGVDWGDHLQCPGQPIIAARQQILTRAQAIVNDGKPKHAKDKPPTWYTRELSHTDPMMFGNDIKKVQGKVGATPDGYYGEDTETRVRGWQKIHNLTADGVVGPLTSEALGN